MPNKKFLEEYPLYRKCLLDDIVPNVIFRDLPSPAVHMYCKECKSEQTFNLENGYYDMDYQPGDYVKGKVLRAKYKCSSCNSFLRFFLLKFYEEEREEEGEGKVIRELYVFKAGQFPAWDINPDKKLSKYLGEYVDYYKKGLICESQGYGIGAYAYYRRITEEIIDELLNSIAGLLEEEEKKEYKEALVKVKKERVAEKKIELVKDILPLSLRPGSLNPLGIMHDALSAGLHGKSDEECMEQAEIVRSALTYLVNEVIRKREESKTFTDSMRKLLNDKDKKTDKS